MFKTLRGDVIAYEDGYVIKLICLEGAVNSGHYVCFGENKSFSNGLNR